MSGVGINNFYGLFWVIDLEPEMKERLEEFLHDGDVLKELRKTTAGGKRSLVLDFNRLLEFDMELAKYLLDSPEDLLEDADSILEDITNLPRVHLRIRNLDKSVEVRKIRSDHLGKFIQIEGVLKRSSEVKPEIKVALFECGRCGERAEVLQTDQTFRMPKICENPNCLRRGPFRFVFEDSKFVDWQSLLIEERPEELSGGRMPRSLDGIIRDDFVDRAAPGERVVVTGTLRAFQERRNNRRKTTFRKIHYVNHIEIQREHVEEALLSKEDKETVEELKEKHPHLQNMIVDSMAPSIFGYKEIKEAIALQLFGCPAVELPDNTRIRGDCHVLLTGDPGTAKSQILKWVANVAPRGIYTSGKKATGAGLTATAVRDEIGGGWTLEAGALTIADGGIATIDEFDKMRPEDAGAILESMEQQTISVAKAGIVATLNTRAAILAAANPRLGRFDEFQSIAEQIDLPPVILSRFDLIFIQKDSPREERDRRMAEHMLDLQQRPEKAVRPPLKPETLRKIIIYARKYIRPKFANEEARERIEDFFVRWRKIAEGGAIPITPRQLEAILRLSKAYARMRLSDEVSVGDAEKAINLLEISLKQVGVNPETGEYDIDLIISGHPQSHRDKFRTIMEIIRKLEEEEEGAASIRMVKEEARAEGISEDFVEEMIIREKEKGRLYEPEEGKISRAVKG